MPVLEMRSERPDWVDELVGSVAARAGVEPELLRSFVQSAPSLWFDGGPDAVAADLHLVARPLAPGELRVRIEPTSVLDRWELSVVAADRIGLLGATASTLAASGISVVSATVTSWREHSLALQRVQVVELSPTSAGEPDWPAITQHLRAVLMGESPSVPPLAGAPVVAMTGSVTWSSASAGEGATGAESTDDQHRWLLHLRSSDTAGLLAAAASALAAVGADVEAAQVRTLEGRVDDVFLVRYQGEPAELADLLGAALGIRTEP